MDDMSTYIFEDGEHWMTAAQAASYLSEQSGHVIKVAYLNQLIRHGRLVARKVGPRLNLYPYSQISTIVVERKPGPKRERQAAPSPNALRQRAYKARRRQQQGQQANLSPAGK